MSFHPIMFQPPQTPIVTIKQSGHGTCPRRSLLRPQRHPQLRWISKIDASTQMARFLRKTDLCNLRRQMRHQCGLKDGGDRRLTRRSESDQARTFDPPHNSSVFKVPLTHSQGVIFYHYLFEVFEVVVFDDAGASWSWGKAYNWTYGYV